VRRALRFSMHSRAHATHSFSRSGAKRKWISEQAFLRFRDNSACSINYY
jgi:hypothetical protein